MLSIDLIERKIGDIESKVIPLDNLSPDDLDYILSLPGKMTEEIYNQTGHVDRMRKCDAHLINIDVARVFVIRECILLWTILRGNLKKYPQMDQICAWLNETNHTHKGELMLREREVHDPNIEREGPAALFGESLEDALSEAPRGGNFVMVDKPAPDLDGDGMSDEDMQELFDSGCVDLGAWDDEPDCKEILLTKVVPPKFVVDFEVEEGDPTELTDAEEFELGFDALTAQPDEKDLIEEVA